MAHDDNLKEVSQLIELSGSNYEIADGEPDIKGWDVKTKQHQKIGKVDDMLFDINSREVKYIIVEVDDSMDLDNKKVLIPIDLVEIPNFENNTNDASNFNNDVNVHQDSVETFDGERNTSQYDISGDNDVVIVPVDSQILRNLPAYNKGNVTNENESAIGGIFNTAGSASLGSSYSNDVSEEVSNPSGYQNNSTQKLDVIEENLQVNKQTVTTGGTRLVSRIVEKPVEKTIELKDEHVTVVRTPIDRPVASADFDAFKEEQVEMTEYSEVPVVKKEARVVEEITVSKDVSEKEEIIKETLRNTEVTTEEIKKPKSRKKNS